MKRWLSLALVLCFCWLPLSATAQGVLPESLFTQDGVAWLEFDAEEGIDYGRIVAGEMPAAPAGLEAMYAWMEMGNADADIWLIRMPHGRVIISASRTVLGVGITADDLRGLWPEMVFKLGKAALFVNDENSCAATATLSGLEWLNTNTMAVLSGEKMLSVTLEGYANCDRGVMTEIWIASPAQPTYLYDEAAYAETAADLEAAQRWLAGVRLDEAAATSEEVIPWGTAGSDSIPPSNVVVRYEDPDGKFKLDIPDNCIVIPPSEQSAKRATASLDVADEDLRQLYLLWLDQAEKTGDTLLIDPNYTTAMAVSVTEGENVTLQGIQAMLPALTEALSRELTEVVQENTISSMFIGGRDYWVVFYGGTYANQPLLLVLMITSDGGSIREINLWFREDAISEEWDNVFSYMLESIEY